MVKLHRAAFAWLVACGSAVPSVAPINDDDAGSGSDASSDVFVASDGGGDADGGLPTYDAGSIAELVYDEHPYMFPSVCPYGQHLTYNLTNGVGTRETCTNDAAASEAFSFSQAQVDALRSAFGKLTLVPRAAFNDGGCSGFDGAGYFLYVTYADQSKEMISPDHSCSPDALPDRIATAGFHGADGMRSVLKSVAGVP
jgi:hypothetical protein